MIRSRTILKSYFNTGDRPTEAQFNDLIDSSFNWNDDTYRDDFTDADLQVVTIDGEQHTVLLVNHNLDSINFVSVIRDNNGNVNNVQPYVIDADSCYIIIDDIIQGQWEIYIIK